MGIAAAAAGRVAVERAAVHLVVEAGKEQTYHFLREQ